MMKRSYILAVLAAVMAFFSCAKEEVPVETLSFNISELSIEVGGVCTIEASIHPEEARKSLLSWTSSDPSVASVDENGCVRALAEGEAVVKAIAASGVFAECAVFVTPKVTGVVIPQELSLDKGQTTNIRPDFLPEGAATLNYRWESLNPAVATVDGNGNVTAVGSGETKIRVIVTNVDGEVLVDECIVKILSGAVNVSLEVTSLDMVVGGDVEVLTAILDPVTANKYELEWSSSDDDVVSVERDPETKNQAVVTAVGPGEATITVSLDGSQTAVATCTVNVVQNVTGVEINKTETVIEKGESEQLTATVTPANASNARVTWASSEPSVATVDETGLVSALTVGETVITATTEDGGKIAYCRVKVNQKVTGVTLNKTEISLRVGENATEKLIATVGPEDAVNKQVTWTSNDTRFATVAPDGTVTAVAGGTAVITVTTVDQNKTASCVVTVIQPAISIKLSETLIRLNPGTDRTLSAVLNEGRPAPTNSKVHWISNNPAVAEVDENGKVTGKSVGTTYITAYSDDDNTVTATCAVNVSWNVTDVELNASKAYMVVGGKQLQLVCTVIPDNATNKNVTWSSSASEVVEVSPTGLLTAKGEGTAVITVTTQDQNLTATCTVVVRPAGSSGSEGFEGSDGQIPWN